MDLAHSLLFHSLCVHRAQHRSWPLVAIKVQSWTETEGLWCRELVTQGMENLRREGGW